MYESFGEPEGVHERYSSRMCSKCSIIRFNPDKYINENDKKFQSSFKLDKTTGKLVIRQKNDKIDLIY